MGLMPRKTTRCLVFSCSIGVTTRRCYPAFGLAAVFVYNSHIRDCTTISRLVFNVNSSAEILTNSVGGWPVVWRPSAGTNGTGRRLTGRGTRPTEA